MEKTEKARQTLTGLIRSRMATYEARQLAGVTQKTFAQELNDEGYRISYSDFRTLFARARKQLAAKKMPFQPEKQESHEERNIEKKAPENPLTKTKGFEYKGTQSFDKNDLI